MCTRWSRVLGMEYSAVLESLYDPSTRPLDLAVFALTPHALAPSRALAYSPSSPRAPSKCMPQAPPTSPLFLPTAGCRLPLWPRCPPGLCHRSSRTRTILNPAPSTPEQSEEAIEPSSFRDPGLASYRATEPPSHRAIVMAASVSSQQSKFKMRRLSFETLGCRSEPSGTDAASRPGR